MDEVRHAPDFLFMLLLPGQPLSVRRDRVDVGEGAYARDAYVLASRIGYEDVASKEGRAEEVAGVRGTKAALALPRPGSTVVGRVTRVNARQATVSILVVDGEPCGGAQATSVGAYSNRAAGEGVDGTDFQGVVRAQDVRSTDKDTVVMTACFRPGDIVRARVISLGDARAYYLSTAENELGVVHATTSGPSLYGWAPAQHTLEPVSWCEMADPATGHVERRKCAKPSWLTE